MTLAEKFGLVAVLPPRGGVVDYSERASCECLDCGRVFSDAVAPLHEERTKHRTRRVAALVEAA